MLTPDLTVCLLYCHCKLSFLAVSLLQKQQSAFSSQQVIQACTFVTDSISGVFRNLKGVTGGTFQVYIFKSVQSLA